MIDQKELRIGNWVSIDKQDTFDLHKYIQVDSIYKDGVNAYYDCAEESTIPDKYCSEISGIELTPEILKKTPFYETEIDGVFIYSKRGVITVNINSIGLVSFSIGGIVFSTVHYLHHLQNLYFSLTGEELTYTP